MRAPRFWTDRFQAYRVWTLERCRGAPAAPPRHAPADIVLCFLDRHARRDWVCQRGAEADWRQYRVALQHGHELVVARRGDVVVGWAWIGYERVHLPPLGRDLFLTPGTAYLYDAYVRPGERGRGIGRLLVGARCERADGRGIERLLSHVKSSNRPSIAALEACGFRVVGRSLFLKALALRLWTQRPVPAPRAA